MYFFVTVINIVIVLFLLRLLIRPSEASFDPIYRLIYRITDPLLIPSRQISRDVTKGVLVSLLALVVIRGSVYPAVKPMTLMAGVGVSFLDLFRLLFQVYMVMWFVSCLSKRGFGTSFITLVERAFLPLNSVRVRLGVPVRQFHLFAFLFLWFLYALLTIVVRYLMISGGNFSPFSILYGLGEGLSLFLTLFPFPGFFSLVIIIGALLSWVSPDPSNPIVQAIYGISEPLLAPFRRFLPSLGGLDISPILALLCFQILGGLGQQIVDGLLKTI